MLDTKYGMASGLTEAICKLLARPPITGPRINPRARLPLIKPKFLAFLFSGLISAITDWARNKLPPLKPSIIRAIKINWMLNKTIPRAVNK